MHEMSVFQKCLWIKLVSTTLFDSAKVSDLLNTIIVGINVSLLYRKRKQYYALVY